VPQSAVRAFRRHGAPLFAVSLMASLLTAIIIGPANAADGELDPSFSGDGRVVSDFGFDDRAEGVVVQPDGRIVVAGTSCGGDFLVARYNADGSVDTTFGSGGRVCIDVGSGSADRGEEILLLAGGQLVVAGTSAGDFALARLTATGALDSSFGNGARATYDLGGTDELRDAALAPDGRIVMVGETTMPGCATAPTSPGQTVGVGVARALSNGAPDPSFGGDGTVVLGSGDQVQRGFAVAVQNDGAVIVAGRTSSCSRVAIDLLLLRLTAGGAPDPGFVPANPLAEPGPDSAVDVAVQPDGRIVVAVDTFVGPATSPARDDAFILLRFNPDGSADTSFGSGGVATALFGAGTNATPRAIALQGSTIVVGGSVDGDFALARFTSTGALDPAFGGDGTVVTDFGGVDVLAALAVQPDGKLVAAGQTATDVALARYGTGTTSTSTSTSTSTTTTTTSTSSTSSSTTSTTITPSPFTEICAVLDQLRSAFAANPWLRPFVGIIDAVRALLRCS
jgi:uncharacterized delta-60 repeat protein